jgi:SNF2 family DNA or RNA helicase
MGDKSFQDKVRRSLVVFDEAHNMGGDKSVRGTITKNIDPKKLLLLTGTPMRNRPSELVPLLLALKAKGAPLNKKEFNKKFITDANKDPNLSIWQRLKNSLSGQQHLVAKNIDKFKKMIDGKVDYHDAVDPKYYPSTEMNVVEVPMTEKHLAIYSKMMSQNPDIKYKVEHDIQPNKMEISKMQNFLIGPRMAANTPAVVSDQSTFNDSTKIRRMVKDIVDFNKKDKKFKGLVYSNFLGAGVEGMAEALKEKKIKYELFTGQMNDKQKKAAVDAFNKGKSKVLLVSGAGAEGIDLKGTKLVQIMEPHWNSARVNQAIGRAVRHKSHTHLPEKDQHVVINKYVSTVPQSWLAKLLKLKSKQGVDGFMMGFAKKKDELNAPFLAAMRGEK